MRTFFETNSAVVAIAATGLLVSSLARAQEEQPAPPHFVDRSEQEAANPLKVGAIAGVGFPRPLSIEGMLAFGRVVAIGGEYGVLPATTIDGVQGALWSVAGDARIYPFRGAFFVGLRAGFQHIEASTQVAIESVPAGQELTYDAWFLNPRIGWLWTFGGPFVFGFEAGVQVPVKTEMTSSLSLSIAPEVQRVANVLGAAVIPTIDLLRIGLMM